MPDRLEWKRQSNQQNAVSAEFKTGKKSYRAEIRFETAGCWQWEIREKPSMTSPEDPSYQIEEQAVSLATAAEQAEAKAEEIRLQTEERLLAAEQAEAEIAQFIRSRKQ